MHDFNIHKYVPKPWGWERWVVLNDKFCLKEIMIKKGHKTSLQYHEVKQETTYIQEGSAKVWLKKVGEKDFSIYENLGKGTTLNLMPGDVHRIEAIEDVVLWEASTPEVEDVIRLEDSYGRKS